MNRPARLVAVVPLVAGLGWLGAYALQAGAAGTIAFDSGVTMSMWSSSRVQQPASEALMGVREELERALTATPRDPAIHELLGLIDARRIERPEYLSEAAVHFARAIELRPTSPQTWANLAAMKYRMGNTGPEFEASLRHAVELGAYEPDAQAIVANFGLAVWNEVSQPTRAAIEMAATAGMARNPVETLQIAERRGRLDVACRHLPGSTRQTDPKWSQPCQSMEATP